MIHVIVNLLHRLLFLAVGYKSFAHKVPAQGFPLWSTGRPSIRRRSACGDGSLLRQLLLLALNCRSTFLASCLKQICPLY